MRYERILDDKRITVDRGQGYIFESISYPVNSWGNDEGKLASVGLRPIPVIVQTPYVPTLAERIAQVSMSAKMYIDDRLDPDGMIMINDMASYDPPNEKAVLCKQWLVSIRIEQYNRIAQLEAGLPWSEDMADFSGFGDKPYTIAQLMMEM